MSKYDKLVEKIRQRRQVSYKEAESLLLKLGYKVEATGSHHVFRKPNCKPVNLKKRPQLLAYQLAAIEEAVDENN